MGIAEQTNIYSIQKRGICVNTSKKELEQCLGFYFRMWLCQMPGTRCYWERATAYPLISHVMPRNRFRLLLTVIHCVDNMSATEETKKDKIWKVRPVVDCVRKNCLKIIPEEHNAIDEMMVAFKGTTSQIRQYVKGKPHPWGFKIWVRPGVSGMVYDFEVNQGGTGIRTKLGQDHHHHTFWAECELEVSPNAPTKMKVDYDDMTLLNIGSCGLHVIHGAFKDGCVACEWNLKHIFSSMYILFNETPARREDYVKATGSNVFPVKFCYHRWLENVPVAERTLMIWQHSKKYVSCVEKKTCQNPRTASFDTIKAACSDVLTTAKIHFFLSVSK